jgi:peptide/nickel transport system substrate-binding protein
MVPYMRRPVWAAAALMGITLLAAACGGGAAVRSTAGGGATTAAIPGAPDAAANRVVIMQGVDANTLDPAFTNATPEDNILMNIMQGLITRDANESLVPLLATAWKNLDPTTWDFTLRQGVKFQDGEDFNADAVKYTFDRLADPNLKAPNVSVLKRMQFKEVKVVGPYEVQIVTSAPQPILPDYLANFYILAPQYYSSHPEGYLATHPIGTGPFQLVSWVKNQAVTLQRWSGYWGPQPQLAEIVFKPEPEPATQLDALKTGAADIVTLLAPDQVKTVQAFPNAKVAAFESSRDVYIGFSVNRPYFKDARVRQAFNYAVNWDAIKNSLLGGYGERLGSIVRKKSDRNPAVQPYPYDPAKAKQLLAAANFPMDQQLILDTPVGRYTDDQQIAQVVASDLGQIGVHVTVKPVAWSIYAGQMAMQKKMDDLWLLGLGSTFTYQTDLFNVNPQSATDPSFWVNPEYIQAWNQLSQTFDPEQRRQLSYRIQQIIHDDPEWIFLWQQWEFYGVNKHLNYTPRPDEALPMADVSWQH